MDIKEKIRDKWLARVKQFGLPVAYMQIGRAIIRSIYVIRKYTVFAVVDHRNEKFYSANVKTLTPSVIESRKRKWNLPSAKLDELRATFAKDCKGFMIEQEGKLAAYAFVQYSGIYAFAKSGKFLIPRDMAVLKNLYVFREFRGKKLGKELNRVRLLSIPEGATPLGFVMPENRYAIRNLAMCGFTEILKITRITWFSRISRQKVTIINDIPITRQIIEGLKK